MKTTDPSVTFLSILIVALISIPLKGQIHQPLLQVPFVTEAPVVDGKIEDAVWKRSAELSEFVNWSLDSYIKDEVSVFMCFDSRNMYIAFRNSDPAAEQLRETVDPKGPRDTFLWGRNHVLVGIRANDTSLRLIADPKETQTDWKNEDISWNGDWQYRASINKADWTAEFAIPLSELGLKHPIINESLTLSLSRSYPRGESAEWHGTCRLSSQMSSVSNYGKWTSPVPGKNRLSFTAANISKEKQELICELELIPLEGQPEFINQEGQGPSSDVQVKMAKEPRYFRANYTIPPGGTVNENIAYDLPSEGSYYVSALVRTVDGTVLRRGVDFWFTIEPNREKLRLLKERVGESIASMARVSNALVTKLQNDAAKILTAIKDLENSADESWRTGKWNELTAQVNTADKAVARHLHQVRWAAFHNWKADGDFGLAVTHSVLKLRKDALFPRPIVDEIEISMAGNEYESFQLAVLPFGKDLQQLSLEVSDLKDSNGNTIARENVEVSFVDYHNIDWQADYVAPKGWHPDPLIPYKPGLTIHGDEVCRPYWITVYAPKGSKAGDYTGTVTVSAAGLRKVTASIKCRVWDFDLPVASHLKTHSWDQLEYLEDFYNVKDYPIEWYQRLCALLLKNRMNPGSAGVNYVSQIPNSSGQYDFSKVEKVLRFCIERGLTRFSIIQMKKGIYTDAEAAQAFRFVEAYVEILRKHGWLDKALVELWDEPTHLEWPYIKERAERLKKIDAGLRLQLFAEGGPYDFWDKRTDKFGLNKLVDIWAPVNAVEAPQAQADGKEIWAYFCTLARESAPNFFIDCPAIYQRSIAWYCWMYGLDGFEHWSSNYFWRNVHKGKPLSEKWPNVPWDARTYFNFNGEGQLIYPGPDGVPYSSIRLENFRDSMDDYEYLFRLRELLSKNGNDNTNGRLNRYRQLLQPENYLLYKYPREIKTTLEHTLRYPDRPEAILDARAEIATAIEELQEAR